MKLPHPLKHALDFFANSWKPTIAAIFGVVIGVCLSVILTCGQVLRGAILRDTSGEDPVTRVIAQATRYAVMVSLGLLTIVILLEAIRLAVEKFRTASEREHAKQRSYRARPFAPSESPEAVPPAAIIPIARDEKGVLDRRRA